MGVKLTPEEAWDFLARGHTGTLASLRRDGWPVALPVWFAVLDRALYLRTPEHSRKVERIRRDERVSFSVETGHAWVELAGVVVTGTAHRVEDPQEAERATRAIDEKYREFRAVAKRMPSASQKHYAKFAVIRIDPVGDLITWDNAKLRMRPE